MYLLNLTYLLFNSFLGYQLTNSRPTAITVRILKARSETVW